MTYKFKLIFHQSIRLWKQLPCWYPSLPFSFLILWNWRYTVKNSSNLLDKKTYIFFKLKKSDIKRIKYGVRFLYISWLRLLCLGGVSIFGWLWRRWYAALPTSFVYHRHDFKLVADCRFFVSLCFLSHFFLYYSILCFTSKDHTIHRYGTFKWLLDDQMRKMCKACTCWI